MWRARQCRCLNHDRLECVGFGVLELHWSAFSSMGTRWNLTDRDIMELILELDSDAHLLEDDICVQTGSYIGDTDTYIRLWSDNTGCWHSVCLAHKFKGDSSRLQWTESPCINIVAHWVFSCSPPPPPPFFLKVIQVLVVEAHFIPSTWHIGQKTVPTAWRDCLGNVFVSGDFCADEAWSEGHAER
jgi:hypothetical protein